MRQYQCDFQQHGGRKSCQEVAESEGLLQVLNPDEEHPEGLQVTVKVCSYHTWRWSALWGSWPIQGEFEPIPDGVYYPSISGSPEIIPLPMAGAISLVVSGGTVTLFEGITVECETPNTFRSMDQLWGWVWSLYGPSYSLQ